MNEDEQMIIKRVSNAEITLILDKDAIKAVENNIPLRFNVTPEDKSTIKTMRDTLESGGLFTITLVRKKEDDE